jgi:hypothetical protein
MLTDPTPSGIFDDPGVEFVFPQHRHRLALRVVVDAGGREQGSPVPTARPARHPRLTNGVAEGERAAPVRVMKVLSTTPLRESVRFAFLDHPNHIGNRP